MSEGKIETFSGIKGLSEFTVYRYSLGGNATGNASAGRGRNLGDRNGTGEVLMGGDVSRSLPRPSTSSG